MSLDDQLSAFLGETPKQSRADLFTLEVMKRAQRRAFLARLATGAVGAVVLALVLWACAPALNQAVSTFATSLASTAAVLTFVAAILMLGAPGVWAREDFSAD
ncbi:hypothetical protein [Caulobacter sp. X]|uniref:hypothetical protein n=1 Tax=Caulobacter sp. X TaxID=2048901 RepID=UPI000C160248|nr:hypothetical protein [Caulobacter sp. X]PIC00505.1 hypothetical protein CSW60_02775 [Caulobacter sp. X]